MMAAHITRKFFLAVAALFVMVTVTFFLMKALPGDPFSEELLPREIHLSLRQHYGLDAPWIEQYGRYLWSLVTADFGPSLKYPGVGVNEIIKEGLPTSLLLGAQALFVAIAAGLMLGSIAAINKNLPVDNAAMIFATLGISLPNFAIAAILQYFLAIKLSLFPVARWDTPWHTILPTLALAALPTAFIARLARAKMIEVFQQGYIKTAKAKGLTDSLILWRHVLPNALLPILGYLGQLIANILVGSFVIERIFSIPGLGQWFVHSVLNRDYTAIMGLTVLYGILLLSTTFAIDMLYLFLDPELRATTLSKKENPCASL